MCGFFQVIQKDKPINKDAFNDSLNSMNHRGPDATGINFLEKTINGKKIFFASGHKRLSILDLDERSNQPFIENDNILLFNGEIYNYQKIKSQYSDKSILFSTSSDTEVISKVFSYNSYDAINSFNGMWSISFFDNEKNSIFLSRDRYGKKPLFYFSNNEVMCFSSTIKAIKNYLNLSLEFNEKYLLDYLLFGNMFPTDKEETHFNEIKQILPGHNGYVDLQNWNIKQKKYFFLKENSNETNFSNSLLKEKLLNSVELRLNSDRPIALLLSGGIDSSLILSILHHAGHHKKVHVFMGDTGRSDDYKYAQQCVQKIDIKAETIKSDYSTKAFDRFLQICAHHEKAFPFNGNAIAMSQMYEEISKNNIPVVLDGSGGDEIFGGYWQRHIHYALKEDASEWSSSIQHHNSHKPEVTNYNNYIKKELLVKKIFNPFMKISLETLLSTKTLDPLQNADLSFNSALEKDILPGGRLGEWLWHNDRNSMMHSVESRSPFLDLELSQFLYSGYKNKFYENWNKYELRKIFDDFTPLPTQWRVEKQGFRWDGKYFFYNNKDNLIDLIQNSTVLEKYVNKNLFCSVANKFPKIFKSSFSKRIVGIAGIEYMMNHQGI